MRHLLALIVFALLSTSCGKLSLSRQDPVRATPPPTGPTEPPDPGQPVPSKQITLRLFGAPWCTTCKDSFPEIRDALAAEFKGAVRGELYLPTGVNPEDSPTQEVADAYRDFHKLPFSSHTDEGWKVFKSQVQKDRRLPGAVVLDADGKILKAYKPGATTFQVPEIVSYVKGLLQ